MNDDDRKPGQQQQGQQGQSQQGQQKQGQQKQGQQKQGQQKQGQQNQGQQQQQGGAQGQYGEGNYKATRDYNEGLKDHVQHHDIEKEARDAAPRSEEEQREMERAEQVGKSRSKAGPEEDMDDDGKSAA
ncbi:MAG TPA: hypothetical protein VFE23_09405 [Usitatibacter sp.]|jgi:hypothetical protein|nr:hypothetical protein [Usitatibacter sp.]